MRFDTAGDRVGYAASDNHNGERVVLRGCDRIAVVRAVLHGCGLCHVIDGDGGWRIDPQGKLTGDFARTVAASNSAARAIPRNEYRITGRDADRNRHIVVETVSVALAKLTIDVLVGIRCCECCAIGQRGRVGVGCTSSDNYLTKGRVRQAAAVCRNDESSGLAVCRGERRSQCCAVCCAARYSQIVVVNCTMNVCACRVLDALKICASYDDRGNVAAVSTQGLGRCSRRADREQRYGHCQHKDQCQRAGIENLFHA